jgi:hypothetical protein
MDHFVEKNEARKAASSNAPIMASSLSSPRR